MATPSRMNRKIGSGLDQFKMQNEKFSPTSQSVVLGKAQAGESMNPSAFERLQMDPGKRAAVTEEMQASNPSLLGLSERAATSSGRGYYSDERLLERQRRIAGRAQAAALSPFANSNMRSRNNQPRQMAQDSVMGAMQYPGSVMFTGF